MMVSLYTTLMVSIYTTLMVSLYSTMMVSLYTTLMVSIYTTLMVSLYTTLMVSLYTTLMVSLSAKSIHWNEADNQMLQGYFKYFSNGQDTENGTKGDLPSKYKILAKQIS